MQVAKQQETEKEKKHQIAERREKHSRILSTYSYTYKHVETIFM